MQVITGYRYRVEPSPSQGRRLGQYAGACRWVWNEALAFREDAYLCARAAGGRPAAGALGYAALCARLTLWRREKDWLADAPIHPLQQSLRDLDAAIGRFFEGLAAYPRFKSRGRESLRFPDPKQFELDGEWVRLPKLGWMRLRLSRPLPSDARLRNASISREGGHWFVSFCVEHEIADPAAPAGKPIGIDVGVAQSLALSTGEMIALPVPTAAEKTFVARLQRQCARKQTGSRRWRKAQERVARHRRHQVARRRDAAHKATTRLSREHPIIVVEGLKLRSMSASARGTAEEPGCNVAAKAGLNRELLAQAHGELRRLLAYKCERTGARVVAVPAAHTSQTCSCCGHVAAESRQSQALFRCVACGHEENADINAAKIIRAAGLAVPAHGGKGRKAPCEVRTRRKRAA